MVLNDANIKNKYEKRQKNSLEPNFIVDYADMERPVTRNKGVPISQDLLELKNFDINDNVICLIYRYQ